MIFGLFNVKYSEKGIKENPSVYLHGQNNKHFNKFILLRLVFTTISFGALMVYVVYFSTSLTLQPEGLMVY